MVDLILTNSVKVQEVALVRALVISLNQCLAVGLVKAVEIVKVLIKPQENQQPKANQAQDSCARQQHCRSDPEQRPAPLSRRRPDGCVYQLHRLSFYAAWTERPGAGQHRHCARGRESTQAEL